MRSRIIVVLTIVVGAISAVPAVALASSVPQSAAQLPSTVTVTTSDEHGSATMSDVATKKVTFLGFIRSQGLSRKVTVKPSRGPSCWVPRGGVWNSGLTTHMHFSHLPSVSQVKWYWDPAPGVICHVSHKVSPTGLARLLCGNFIMLKKTPPQATIIRTRVILVQSIANLKVHLHVLAVVQVKRSCGSAYGRAEVNQWFKFSDLVKANGAAAAALYAQLLDSAMAQASARVDCSGTTTVTVITTPPPPNQPPTPQPPPNQPPPPTNHPPTGQLMPPKHIFVNDTQPVCVDNMSDPDGDSVFLTFTFLDTNGNAVGTKIGSVWQQPGGAWCQNFKAPDTPQQVSVFVKLDDGHGGTPTLSDNIPVVPDQFEPAVILK
jgi:hypothetical protein